MHSAMQLTLGFELDISHLRIFGCIVQVPIPPPQRTKMGPQRRLGIYVGFDSQVIIVSDKPKPVEIFSWNEQHISYLDPRTSKCENEVNRIIHLQNIANRLPNTFNDASNVTKSHIPVVNALDRIVVPDEHATMDDDPNPLENAVIKITNSWNIENPLSNYNKISDRNEIIIDDNFALLLKKL
ncbi:hypothetical protein Pfo_013861 [Paulownia fortunei]|nr:hypothetical protein Pfo_013861 [Paulownia fortunei]